jgi:hypothetical protein
MVEKKPPHKKNLEKHFSREELSEIRFRAESMQLINQQ